MIHNFKDLIAKTGKMSLIIITIKLLNHRTLSPSPSFPAFNFLHAFLLYAALNLSFF